MDPASVDAFYLFELLVSKFGMARNTTVSVDDNGQWFHAPTGFRRVPISAFTAQQLLAHHAHAWWTREHGMETPEDKWSFSDPPNVLATILGKLARSPNGWAGWGMVEVEGRPTPSFRSSYWRTA